MLNRILDPCGIARVQSWATTASAPSAIDQVVGTVWPLQVGAVANGLVDILCVGPTEWLLVGGNPDSNDLCRRLGRVLAGSPLRVNDVSQGLVRLEFAGPDIRDFLLQGCSLDTHPKHFGAGQCARTRFAGVPIVLRCHDSSRFEGIVAASYREYMLAWLADRHV